MSATAMSGSRKVAHRPPTRSEPLALRIIEASVTVLVVAVLTWEIARNWEAFARDVEVLLPWVIVVAAADLLPVPIWGSVELMMSFPVLLASALIFPPYVAGFLSLVGTIDVREFRREISLLRSLYNRSNVAASVFVASWVFHQFGVDPLKWPEVLAVALVALIADVFVNFSLVLFGTHLLTGMPVLALLKNVYGGSHPEVFLGGYACFGLLAVLMAAVYVVGGNAGLIAFAIPLLLARQMFLYWKRLGEAAQEIAFKQRALSVVSSRIADERREERLALAAGIHDEVLPPLYQVHLLGQVVRNDLASGRLLDLEADVPDLIHAVESADSTLRDMIRDLRKSTIGPAGLIETLRLLVREYESKTHMRIDTEFSSVTGSALTHLLVYQFAREALSNAIRHSNATRIAVALGQEEGSIRLRVTDNGQGFNPLGVDTSSHFGLQLMRERAELAGGVVLLESNIGEGTTVFIRLPAGGQ